MTIARPFAGSQNSFSKREPPARCSSARQEADWEPEADIPPERGVSRAGNLSRALAASPMEADRRVDRTGFPRETIWRVLTARPLCCSAEADRRAGPGVVRKEADKPQARRSLASLA